MALFIGACSSDNWEPDSNYLDSETDHNPYFVSIEEAISKADDFFSMLENETRTSGKTRIVDNIEIYTHGNPLTRATNSTPDFYVLNYADNNGFALMSTDSRKTAVYAFSTEGHMSLADTIYNEGLRNYLLASSDLIPVPGQNDSIGINPNRPVFQGELKILVPPLFSEAVRNWDQLSLNKYVCPNPKDSIPVGCVALATAQIMSHYQWPNRWPIDGYSNAQEKYEFNWVNMNKYRVYDDSERLLEILGRPELLNITYRPVKNGGSSASTYNVSSTMKQMGYLEPHGPTDFSSEIAIAELFSGDPIILRGNAKGERFGHAWTSDGVAQYKEPCIRPYGEPMYRIYYHFIWGNWGGSNGYFYYDDSLKSFEDHARVLDEVDKGHGKIGARYGNVQMIYKFVIDYTKK